MKTCYNTTFATINAKAVPVCFQKAQPQLGGGQSSNCSKTHLVVRYNINLQYQLFAALLESIDIRGSIHGDAQIMSYSILSVFPYFVFMAT